MDLHLTFDRQCNVINQLWLDFRKVTIRPDASAEHLKEAEKIFKLGCAAMFSTMHAIAGAHIPQNVFVMSKFIDDEIEAFRLQLSTNKIVIPQ